MPNRETSGLFLYLNSNKIGMSLNIKRRTGRGILEQLLKDADVFVENMLPHEKAEIRMTASALSQANSQLIVASITPFGQTGNYSNYKGYALNAAALGGICYTCGEPDREPLNYPFSLGHYQSGTIAAFAILMAIFARKKIGKGQHIDISESDCWATRYVGDSISSYLFYQQQRMRTGHSVPGFYPYTFLPCKDGYMSMIAVQGYQWKRFLKIVGGGKIPEWYEKDPRFKDRWMEKEHSRVLDKLLEPWLLSHKKAEIFDLCRKARVPFAPVMTIKEVVEHPHFESRNYFVSIERSGEGTIKCPGAPYRLSKTPWSIRLPAPHMGEHNEKILCNLLGYSKRDLVELNKQKII
jgi:crotonobetainyl-CoA:carnitine CoA-transferase CaiB-like acyl-CoA transferase